MPPPPNDGVPEAIVVGAGQVFLLDTQARAIARWSLDAAAWLAPIAIQGDVPTDLAFWPHTGRLYVSHASGAISEIDPTESAPVPQPFAQVAPTLFALAPAGDLLAVSATPGGQRAFLTLTPEGVEAGARVVHSSTHSFAWSAAKRRLYHLRDEGTPNELRYAPVAVDGSIGETVDGPAPVTVSYAHPIWLTHDESKVILASGAVFDADTLEHLGDLGTYVVDALANEIFLFTVREENGASRFEARAPWNEPILGGLRPGKPLRMFRHEGRLWLVTLESGEIRIARFDPLDFDGDRRQWPTDEFPDDPNEWNDGDDDSYADGVDAFPNDPTEWLDSDGDGIGDNADPLDLPDADGDGYGDEDDAFPNDADEWVDSDFDGVGDNADLFPLDRLEAYDADLDGIGDDADAFPNDPTETVDTDRDGIGDNADRTPLGSSVLALDVGGTEHLRVGGTRLPAAPVTPTAMGFAEDGRFTACDADECVFGAWTGVGRSGRRFAVDLADANVDSFGTRLEAFLEQDLRQRYPDGEVELVPRHWEVELRVAVSSRGRATARLKLPFDLHVTVPSRGLSARLRGAYGWKLRGELAPGG
jgi:hypothetical protein